MDNENRIRYARTIALPQIGDQGQQRLLEARVLIVGAGALGSAAALQLAAAGVGMLRIVDFDTVGLSNLPRQTAYTTGDLGKPKVTALAARLRDANPGVTVEPVEGLATGANFPDLAQGMDLVVEGSDNPATKYMVARKAREAGLTVVLAGVNGFDGQLMTFGPDDSPRYDDIFPEPASTSATCALGTTCSQGAVYSPLPVILGTLQAAEAIKTLTGAGDTLRGRLLLLDLLHMTTRTIHLPPTPRY